MHNKRSPRTLTGTAVLCRTGTAVVPTAPFTRTRKDRHSGLVHKLTTAALVLLCRTGTAVVPTAPFTRTRKDRHSGLVHKLTTAAFVVCATLWPVEQASGEPLKAAVETSVVLQQVPIGQPWNQRAVESIPSKDVWYRMPPWLPGTWSSEFQWQIKNGQRTQIAARTSGTYGKFRDASGQVWDRVRVPFVSTVEQPKVYYVGVVTNIEISEVTEERVVQKKEIEAFLVDKQTQQVLGNRHQSQLSRISLYGDQLCDIATKDGVTSEVYSNKTAPFVELQDPQMRKSFYDFLAANNRKDLIPAK